MASEMQTTLSGQRETSEELVRILTTISHKLDAVSTEVKNLSSRLSAVEAKLENVNAPVVDSVDVSLPNPSANASLLREIEKIRHCIVSCEMCNLNTRHVSIYGLEEKPGENVDMTIRQFLQGVLGVKEVKVSTIPFYAFRVRPMMPTDAYAPILLKFRSHEDRTYVVDKAEKKKKQLAAMGISLA